MFILQAVVVSEFTYSLFERIEYIRLRNVRFVVVIVENERAVLIVVIENTSHCLTLP